MEMGSAACKILDFMERQFWCTGRNVKDQIVYSAFSCNICIFPDHYSCLVNIYLYASLYSTLYIKHSLRNYSLIAAHSECLQF